jgi:hypothetical protein
VTSCRPIAAVCLAALLGGAASVAAQTPRGEGNLTLTYEQGYTRGQLNNAGELIAPDSTDAHALVWDVDFGVTSRLTVNASLPYMSVRFAGGPHPHLVGIHGQPSNLDDGRYHGSAQDFHVGGRWTLVESRRLMVAPFAEAILPSHHYESLGQSVVGQDLRALTIGAAVSGFADAVLPGLYFQTEVSHAVVQKILAVRPDRSRVDSEVGYFLTPRFAVRFVETFQFTHDGVDFVGSRPAIVVHSSNASSFDYFLNHDRLLRTNVVNLGGGVSLALTDSLELFATAAKTAWGENVQRNRAVTVGTNLHFRHFF